MKKYFNIFVKSFFFTSLPLLIISFIVYRRLEIYMAYTKITTGAIIISLIISLSITIFKSEKGKGFVNAIIGYIVLIPALFVFRYIFGVLIFRRVSGIYILIAIVGVIYGLALLVASKKYKTEVNELNRLLLDKEKNKEKTDEED